MHQRLGHLHSSTLSRFCTSGGKSTNMCTSCVIAKLHRKPFRSSLPQADRILYRVHSDVVGPIQTMTPGGNRYFVTFMDEFSRFARVYLLEQSSEVFDKFREFVVEAERHTGQRRCVLKCDRGGEYSSARFLAYAATNGICLEQGPANTPEHNSIADRYNRTIMEQSRAQMIHASIPKFLWGKVMLATSHILNMSPTRLTDDIPVDSWQRACAGSGAHLSDHMFLRVLGCQAPMHVPKSQRRKLDSCAKDLIHIGYKAGSKSYRLWDPDTRRIIVSQNVTFNKSHFPLRDISNYIDDNNDDDNLFQPATNEPGESTLSGSPPLDPSATSPILSPPSSSPTVPAPPVLPTPSVPSCPVRRTQAPQRYGNAISYAAGTRGSHDADNPTHAQAMASPDAEQWRTAMKVEFDLLVSHSVGRLIKRPSHANMLGGMWCFKRKRDTSGAITKYKARWVILGNHQIHGIDYFDTYASAGVQESLMTLHALAASEDLELACFDIITAFLTGSMDVLVHSGQVEGFEDQSKDILLLDQSIYGAKQAHRQFNITLKTKLASNWIPLDGS